MEPLEFADLPLDALLLDAPPIVLSMRRAQP